MCLYFLIFFFFAQAKSNKKQNSWLHKKETEKRDKTIANKRCRRLVKVRIAKRSEVLPLIKEVLKFTILTKTVSITMLGWQN